MFFFPFDLILDTLHTSYTLMVPLLYSRNSKQIETCGSASLEQRVNGYLSMFVHVCECVCMLVFNCVCTRLLKPYVNKNKYSPIQRVSSLWQHCHLTTSIIHISRSTHTIRGWPCAANRHFLRRMPHVQAPLHITSSYLIRYLILTFCFSFLVLSVNEYRKLMILHSFKFFHSGCHAITTHHHSTIYLRFFPPSFSFLFDLLSSLTTYYSSTMQCVSQCIVCTSFASQPSLLPLMPPQPLS